MLLLLLLFLVEKEVPVQLPSSVLYKWRWKFEMRGEKKGAKKRQAR